MRFPTFPQFLAFFALPFVFAILLAGCGGGQSIALYEPVGDSRPSLAMAETACEAQVIEQMAPLRALQQSRAAQRQAELEKMKVLAAIAAQSGHSGGGFMTPEANQHFVNIARGLREAKDLARKRQTIFCACMTQRGWQCGGAVRFKDINAPLPESKTGLYPLHEIVVHNNYDTVRQVISQGADVNVKDIYGATPLHWAVVENAVESVEVLLNGGANPNARDDEGATPLHFAGWTDKNSTVVKILVKYGAEVKSVSHDDWTPLHTAARHNSRKVVGLLISEGADIDAQGGDEGMTPLHRAALYGSAETADLLIARGANLDAKTYADETPLDIAKQEGKRDVIALLERAARKTEGVESAIDSADGGGNAESVFENAWRSVVVVVAGESQGGGVVINEPNRVATNCHVVDESPNDIRVYKGENRRAVRDAPHSAEIVSGDRERDVCILSVPGLWAIPAKIRSVSELEIGEEVYAVGAPKGFDFSISNGIVSQLREEAGGTAPLIQTNAAISPGSSGGGLFDSEGRLVGLTTWKIREGENLNFAIPIEWALGLE